MLRVVTVVVDEARVGVLPALSTDPVLRLLTALTFSLYLALSPAPCRADELIDGGLVTAACHCDLVPCDGANCDPWCDRCRAAGPNSSGPNSGMCGAGAADDYGWLDQVRVGYDGGFVIASRREVDLQASRFPFLLRLNGWGQLRYTVSDVELPNEDLNQFQLKRARLIFSGHAFNPDFAYFVQLDGRSSSGDDVRLLDYRLSYDFGHDQFGLEPGTIGFRTGKYKMPFSMARWLSGKEFEFTDRSVASIFFDVNRSLAWGLYGETQRLRFPIEWETAIFNGFVTGGAETGSSGDLDNKFAYSVRVLGYPIGQWGAGELADFEDHQRLAMRVGCGFAATTIDRDGQTEFNALTVVDSGNTLASILPAQVDSYSVTQFAIDASFKLRGWSTTLEYYFRNITDFSGAAVPDLFDHGFWFQLGYFVIPNKVQLLTRWSHVEGDSGTLGTGQQSTEDIAAGMAWYFRRNQAKLVADVTYLDGGPINSSSLDITPGDQGWLYRTQIQFSF